jgi:predicted  nucleic acid-binding Zn-ribbon protein
VESEKQRHEVQQALQKAIADLGRRADTLKSALSGGKLSAPETEIYEHELAHVTGLAGQRKAQLLDVTVPSPDVGEQTASKGEADDLKQLFNDARRDISSEFSKTLRLYHAAAAEREKIHALKENLAAREKWLSENDPAGKSE